MERKLITALLISLIAILSSVLVLAAVNLSVDAPAFGDVITGTNYAVNFTFDDYANVTIKFYNNSGWTMINTTTNATGSPFIHYFDTTQYADLAQRYQFNITVTNYTNASDVESSIINISIDNDAPNVTIVSPANSPYDGQVAMVINASYEELGTNVSSCNWTIYNSSGGYASSADWMDATPDPQTGYVNYTVGANNVTEGGGLNITVWCLDTTGNVGMDSASFGYDTSTPTAQFGTLVSPLVGTVLLNGSANDTFGFTNYTIWIRNASINQVLCYNTSQRTDTTLCTWDTTAYADSGDDNHYNLTITAYDGADHSATDNLNWVNITNTPPDVTAPYVTIDTPGTGTYMGTLNFTITAVDTELGVSSVRLINTSGTSGVPMTLYNGTAADGGWTVGIDSTALADGPRNFTVNATDGTNHNDSAILAITIDNTGPYVAYSEPHLTPYNNTNKFLTVVAPSDAYAATFRCNLTMSNTTAVAYNYTANTTGENIGINVLGPGNWTWNITCWDDALLMGVGTIGNSNTTTNRYYVVDTTNPSTTDNSSAYSGWNSAAFIVNLTATDDLAGIQTTYYTFDGGGPTAGTSIGITTDGNHTITYYSVDNAGNVETTNTAYAALDTGNPTAVLSAPTDETNSTDNSPQLTFTLTDTFDASINYTVYVNGLANATGYAANTTQAYLNVSLYSDGTYILIVEAEDDAGNKVNSSAVTYRADSLAPTTTDNSSDYAGWQGSAFNVTLTETDATSGVRYTTYTIGGGAATNGSSVPVTTDGNQTITYYSVDWAGNVQGTVVTNVSLDTQAPTVAITAPSTNGRVQPIYAITGTVSDDDSGVSYVELSINGTIVGNATVSGSSWNYTRTSTNGLIENITAQAFDNAGKSAVTNVTNVTIDDEVPMIWLVSSGNPTTTTATITWTTNESTNSTVAYGTSSGLGLYRRSTSLVTSHSVSLTSLTDNQQYYYNVTSCDAAGNCNTTGPNTFTTDEDTTNNGGTSGGGGGGGVISAGNQLTTRAQRTSLTKYGTYYFQVKGDKLSHRVRIKEFEKNGVWFTFSSDPVNIFLEPEQKERVDITGDGEEDVEIELVEFTFNQKAIFTLAQIDDDEDDGSSTTSSDEEEDTADEVAEATAPVQQTTPDAPAETAEETEEGSADAAELSETERQASTWWIWVLVGVCVIVAIILTFGRSKGPKTEERTYDSSHFDMRRPGDKHGHAPPKHHTDTYSYYGHKTRLHDDHITKDDIIK